MRPALLALALLAGVAGVCLLAAQTPDNWCQCPDGTCVRPVLWGRVCPEGCLLAPDCTSDPYPPEPTPTPTPPPQPTPTPAPTPTPGPTPTPQPSDWRAGSWPQIPAPWNYLEHGATLAVKDAAVAWLNAAKCCYHPDDPRWVPETMVQLRVSQPRTWQVLWPGTLPDQHEQGFPKPVEVRLPAAMGPVFGASTEERGYLVAYATTRTSTIGQEGRVTVGLSLTRADGTPVSHTLDGIVVDGVDQFPLGWSWRGDQPVLWVREHRDGIGYTTTGYLLDLTRGQWINLGRGKWHLSGSVYMEQSPHVNDVAWGEDGVLYALATPGGWDSGEIEEWYSLPEGSWGRPGRLWHKTGRVWVAPPGESYHAPGYLRTPDGRRVEPTVIVTTQHAEGAWATDGWYLGWIAHLAARLPAGW